MKNVLLLFTALLLLISTKARGASEIRFLFWYPGEAGSTEEAQPLLDLFCEAVTNKLPGTRCSALYIDDETKGLALIPKKQIDIIILSHRAWVKHPQHVSLGDIWLATLPSPHGMSVERYSLMGVTKKFPPESTIYASPHVNADYIRKHLFADLPADAQIITTPQLLEKLRAIGSGKEVAWGILSPAEAMTITSLQTNWSKNIVELKQSASIPSPYVLLLNPKLSKREELKRILLAMKDDPSLHELLAELRLKGFALPMSK